MLVNYTIHEGESPFPLETRWKRTPRASDLANRGSKLA